MAIETKEYDIVPVPKPRMTRKDKWKPSKDALRYFAYKDEVRLKCVKVPECNYHITFYIPMPESWSEKKKLQHDGYGHQNKRGPDKDNLEKALLDAIYGNDAHIWDGRVTKRWGRTGKIVVTTF